jgi:uncharacterized protein (DUF2267 family)
MDKALFIAEVGRRLRCDPERSEGIVFAVFQELHRRLPPKEAADVAAQLAPNLRSMWNEEHGRADPPPSKDREEFVARVRACAGLTDDAEAERAARAVFRALQLALGSPHGREGEAWDVLSVLPKDLKLLWMAAAEGRGPGQIV